MTAPWIYSTTPDGRASLIKTLKTPIHDGWESSVILQTTVNKSLDPGFAWRHRGTPDTIRTYDLLLRKQTLYPAELRVHTTLIIARYRQVCKRGSALQTEFCE